MKNIFNEVETQNVCPEKGVKVNTIKEMDLTLLACEIRC